MSNINGSLSQFNGGIANNTPKPKTVKPKSTPRVPVKLVFTPKEVGVDSNSRNKPNVAKVSENQIEAKLFNHFKLDSKQDEALIKKRLNTANNPFNEIKTTGNFTVVLNRETKNYELTSKVEKGLYKRLEGKAVEIKKEVEAEKSEQKNANLSPSDKFANKQGFDNSANQKAELDAKLKENQASMSAPNRNDAEKSVKSATDTIEKITGTQDIFDSGEIGKQFNRLGVSTLRLGGKAMELSNYLSEKVNAAVRYVAPDAVDTLLDKADQTNRETAKALQNANSAVTNDDNYIDNKAKAEGWKIPLESDLARKVMYAPEGLPNAIDSAVKGDFKDDDGSYSDKVGKMVGGLNPVGDVRDVIANAKNVLQGKKGAVVGLGAAIIGTAPIVGDGAKILLKAEKEVIQEGLESIVKQEAKEVGKGGLEKLAKEETAQVTKQVDEFANSKDIEKVIGKDIKIGDKLPEGYKWNGGQIHRNNGNVDANYAKLQVDENGKIALSQVERLSNPNTMNKNFLAKVRAEYSAKGLKGEALENAVKAEKARIQVHHLIPDELIQKSNLGKAAQKAGYNLDEGSNLLGLPRSNANKITQDEIGHWTNHKDYTKLVQKRLKDVEDNLIRKYKSLDKVPPKEIKEKMRELENEFRNLIKKSDKSIPTKDGRLSFAPINQTTLGGRYEIRA